MFGAEDGWENNDPIPFDYSKIDERNETYFARKRVRQLMEGKSPLEIYQCSPLDWIYKYNEDVCLILSWAVEVDIAEEEGRS